MESVSLNDMTLKSFLVENFTCQDLLLDRLENGEFLLGDDPYASAFARRLIKHHLEEVRLIPGQLENFLCEFFHA